MNARNYFPLLLLSMFLLFSSCRDDKPVSTEKKQFSIEDVKKNETSPVVATEENTDPNLFEITREQFEKSGMELGTAGISSVSDAISAGGYIEVPNEGKAEVRSYIGGYLGSSPLLPGNLVKKGQYLISLENIEYVRLQQDYLRAKEDLNYLKTVYDRKKILAEENITSINSRQAAESDYNSALADYEGLRKMLKLINIDPDKLRPENISSSINLYAPINGYITRVNAVNGKFAEPTDVIFEIISTDHLHIELRVYEKDILNIEKGQKVSFRIPEANAKSYSAEVFLVGKTIEEEGRTVTVHCHIDEYSKFPVFVGMYIEAQIYYNTMDRFCLPVNAFVRDEGRYFLYVVRSVSDTAYTFEKTNVEVGQVNEDCIEVVGAGRQMLEQKQVLVKGAFDI